MSVFMSLVVKGDAAKLEATSNERAEVLEAIGNDAKARGAIHHRFYASADGDAVMVFDEWDSAESFQAFFEAHPEIGEMMASVGVTEKPTITFWRALETGDQF